MIEEYRKGTKGKNEESRMEEVKEYQSKGVYSTHVKESTRHHGANTSPISQPVELAFCNAPYLDLN